VDSEARKSWTALVVGALDGAPPQPDANSSPSPPGTAAFRLIGVSGVEAHQNQRVAVVGLMIRTRIVRKQRASDGFPAVIWT
jgi:hypothetical protein